MNEERWKKIVAQKAKDVIGNVELTDESLALLTDEIRPEAFVRALESEGQLMDAIKTLAYSLPRREAVWWACKCVPDMQDVVSAKSELEALDIAEKWVYEPTDDRRTAAFKSAQESSTSSGGFMCAMAVAFSEATLQVSAEQEMDVDTAAFPGMIFAAIIMAAAEGDGTQMDQRSAKYLKIGEEIAQGGSGKLDQTAKV